MPHHHSIAIIRMQQAGKHGYGGGLSSPVGTEKAEDFSFFHLE